MLICYYLSPTCDSLQCKEYEDYLQGEGGFKKPPRSCLNVLNATEKMNKPIKVTDQTNLYLILSQMDKSIVY